MSQTHHHHHDHRRTVERQCDVAVIGGSAAGLAGALELGRRGRSVIVVDAGEPGDAPAGFLDAARDEVRGHGCEVVAGRVVDVAGTDDGRFRLELVDGHAVFARRVIDTATLIDAADGTGVGVAVDESLAEDDVANAARVSAHQLDWDHRYGGAQMWSGNPNGTLVAEVSDLAPGDALDVGAGEGGDAMWLADRGWHVTANDISRLALHRISAEAERRGHHVDCVHADANASQPFGDRTFDLVSAQYASIPRTPDDRAVRNLLDAVRPGGTLLVVSHDLEPMRTPIDTSIESRPFDAEAFVRVEDVADALAASPEWEIEVHTKRPRPPGAASSHHVDDLVLRARRRA